MTWATSTGQHLIPFPVPGTTLTSSRGKYVVGALIGDGQYGSVYECVGPFDQAYALKMLRPANKPYHAVKEEWSHEMMRLESVRHPNIVYIRDAFEDNFLFYFALEKCDTNLKALLGRHPGSCAVTVRAVIPAESETTLSVKARVEPADELLEAARRLGFEIELR